MIYLLLYEFFKGQTLITHAAWQIEYFDRIVHKPKNSRPENKNLLRVNLPKNWFNAIIFWLTLLSLELTLTSKNQLFLSEFTQKNKKKVARKFDSLICEKRIRLFTISTAFCLWANKNSHFIVQITQNILIASSGILLFNYKSHRVVRRCLKLCFAIENQNVRSSLFRKKSYFYLQMSIYMHVRLAS